MSVRLNASLPEQRQFVHQDLMVCGVTLTFAVASLALKRMFLSTHNSWLGQIPSFLASWAGWNACQQAYKAINFYQKRRQLTAPALHLSLQKNEQAFENAFRDIQFHRSYHDVFDPRDPQQATERFRKTFFRDLIAHGTCAGQADMLLEFAKEAPNISSLDLLKRINQENRIQNIFYRQMMYGIRSRLESLVEAFHEASISIELSTYQKEAAKLMLEEYQSSLLETNKKLHPQVETTTELFSITQPSKFYLEKLENYLSRQPSHQLMGQVHLETSTLFQNGQFLAGHTLFFQCTPGCYRFYDPITPIEGFYEYQDKESFIKALRSQLIEDVGSQAKVRFSNC